MVDTGEDEEVTLDTAPMRIAARYRAAAEEVAPGTVVYFATDGDLRVPAKSEEHAAALAVALTFVELHFFGTAGWISWVRRRLLGFMRRLNAADRRFIS